MSPDDEGVWRERLRAVGSAQGRYFSALALAGLFYYALDIQLIASPDSEHIGLPLVGGRVAAATLQSTAPIVLGILMLAVLGAASAITEAARRLGVVARTDAQEFLGVSFNLLDAVTYTTPATPAWAARLSRAAYPAVLTAFWIEAMAFLIQEFARSPSMSFPDITYPLWQASATYFLRALSVLLLVTSAGRLLPYLFPRASRRRG